MVIGIGIAILLSGGSLFFLGWRVGKKPAPHIIKKEAHVVVERIQRVCKLIHFETHVKEILRIEDSKPGLMGMGTSTKKALVVAKARIAFGHDLTDFRWEHDVESRTIKIVTFPKLKVLSTEVHDLDYYDIQNGWFNKFTPEDYTAIHRYGFETVNKIANEQELPRLEGLSQKLLAKELEHIQADTSWKVVHAPLAIGEGVESVALLGEQGMASASG